MPRAGNGHGRFSFSRRQSRLRRGRLFTPMVIASNTTNKRKERSRVPTNERLQGIPAAPGHVGHQCFIVAWLVHGRPLCPARRCAATYLYALRTLFVARKRRITTHRALVERWVRADENRRPRPQLEAWLVKKGLCIVVRVSHPICLEGNPRRADQLE